MTSSVSVFTSICQIIAGLVAMISAVVAWKANRRASKALGDIRKLENADETPKSVKRPSTCPRLVPPSEHARR
jgi:hypothetical protein